MENPRDIEAIVKAVIAALPQQAKGNNNGPARESKKTPRGSKKSANRGSSALAAGRVVDNAENRPAKPKPKGDAGIKSKKGTGRKRPAVKKPTKVDNVDRGQRVPKRKVDLLSFAKNHLGVWVAGCTPATVNRYWIAQDADRSVDVFEVSRLILGALMDTQPEICRLSRVSSWLDKRDIILANLEMSEYWDRFSNKSLTLDRALLQGCAEAAIKKVYTEESEKESLSASKRAFYLDDAQLHTVEEDLAEQTTGDVPDFWQQRAALEAAVAASFDVSRKTRAVCIGIARNAIEHMLKDVPSYREISERCKHGPGSTQSVNGAYVASFYKDTDFSVYSHSVEVVSQILVHEQHFWEAAGYDIRRIGSKDEEILNPMVIKDIQQLLSKVTISTPDDVVFVGKDWKALRPICPGQTLNVYCQLGVGSIIDDRLRGVGIDIHDQERNKLLARRGSVSGRFATIDLHNASGLISTEHVRQIFPLRWFELLDSLRGKSINGPETHDGPYIHSFFSGMGNGFTFPVETAVFYGTIVAAYSLAGSADAIHAANKAIAMQHVAIYGDDIVVPTELVPFVYNAMYLFGFKVNANKSFVAGPFRESCGGDYFLGTDVRPPYVRCCSAGRVGASTIIAIHNGYAKLGEQVLPDGTKVGPIIGSDKICQGLRDLWRSKIHPVIPTSTDGRGFLPAKAEPYCTLGVVSEYQRWGTFITAIHTQTKKVKCVDPHLYMRALFSGGKQDVQGALAVSLRGKTRMRLEYDRAVAGSKYPYIYKVKRLLQALIMQKKLRLR